MPAMTGSRTLGATLLPPRLRRAAGATALLACASLLAACTANDVMRPSIDVGATSAIAPGPVLKPSGMMSTPQAIVPQNNVPQASSPSDLFGIAYPTIAPQAGLPQSAPPQMALNASPSMQTPSTGSRIVYLPASAAGSLQEPETYRPLADAPGAAAAPPQVDLGEVEPKQDDPGMMAQLAALPGRIVPDFLKPGARDTESQCRRDLKRLGVTFEDVAPVGNGGGGGCGIANPVRITKLAGGTSVKPAAVLNCRMAVAFAEWVKKDVQGAARTRYLSGVAEIRNMSSYSCRTIGNKRGGRLPIW
jgi:hypothetical protein